MFILIPPASNSRYGKLNFADWLVFKWKHWSLLIVARRHYHQLCICSHPCGQQRVVTFTKPENVNVRWLLQYISCSTLNECCCLWPPLYHVQQEEGRRQTCRGTWETISAPLSLPLGAPHMTPSLLTLNRCLQCYAATGEWGVSCNWTWNYWNSNKLST